MSRFGFKVNKNSYEYARSERVNWLDNFADKSFASSGSAGKSAVEVARERSQTSLYDQVSAIVENSTHATVESKVKDMQERTGLTEYLKRFANDNEDIFEKFGPKMQADLINFCKNKIKDSWGQISVPTVQYELLSTFKQHGLQPQDVENYEVARCISKLITDELRINPPTDTTSPELGRSDTQLEDDNENSDFFKGLMPNN